MAESKQQIEWRKALGKVLGEIQQIGEQAGPETSRLARVAAQKISEAGRAVHAGTMSAADARVVLESYLDAGKSALAREIAAHADKNSTLGAAISNGVGMLLKLLGAFK